jgi:hypothetical protein
MFELVLGVMLGIYACKLIIKGFKKVFGGGD